ncbi:hypothetical protein LCGC14_0743110 [marine sediment metagenome]|uniref:AP2/ERF domain-containing protein n=1 Tax=marine sediment metagenome TaxID=412755 RepID=A0A0F9SR34_9ZZZZ
MKIPLTQNKFAAIDDNDFEKVSQIKWQYCLVGKKRDRECAMFRGNINGKKTTIIMSRFIMNAPKGKVVDHKNGNCLDNRRNNLRICTNQQNIFNQKPRRIPNMSSEHKGVSWLERLRKWRAYISPNGKQINLGLFLDESKAAMAYNQAAIEHFGEYARLNNV